MRSRSRLIIRGLKPEDFKCDLPEEEEETLCSDCGVVMKIAIQIIGGRCYCKECAPWYREQEKLDRIIIEQDLLRGAGVNPPRRAVEELEAELFGERDYWD